jgi:hypothetical protein
MTGLIRPSCSIGVSVGTVFLRSLGLPRLVRRSPALDVAGSLCRSPCPAALGPLGQRVPPPQFPHPGGPCPRAGPGGFVHPGGSHPCVPPGGVSRLLLGLRRSAPPRVAGVRRPMPDVPPAVSGRPSAPWPGVTVASPRPPPPHSPLKVLVPTPRRPGAFAHPRGAPLRSSGRGRAAAAWVGTLCATAGRWGSPADALVAHGCLPLRTLWLCVPPRPPLWGARGSGHL